MALSVAPLSPRDRGLAYGDGVFETLRVSAGRVPLWSLHRARLLAGCAALGIDIDAQRLEQVLAQLPANATAVLKITVTRGEGGRGYLPPAAVTPSLFWQLLPLPVWSEHCRHDGIELGICDQPLYPEPLAGFKHLNRLPQVQARRQVARQGWQEGLLLSPRRQPLEATAMNLFARFDDDWWTADLAAASAGVNGVMRQWLIGHFAEQGQSLRCDLRPLSQLRQAQCVFLCNSVAGILPVRKLAQWHWPVPAAVHDLQQTIEALF